MRASELLEITRLPPNHFNDLSKKDIDDEVRYGRVSKNAKPLPGNSGLMYSIEQKNKAIVISILDSTTKEVVGYLKAESENNEKHFPIKNAHSVSMIAVDPNRRSQGIAKSLYGIYLSILKYPLLAGNSQTSGGRQNWLSLAKIPGVTVKGYVEMYDRFFDEPAAKKNFDKFVDSVMAMGGEYLGDSLGGRLRYFAFDVEPGNGELQPAVKKQLQLYGNKFSYYYQLGMYAVWEGK
jgi:hypothetical protein